MGFCQGFFRQTKLPLLPKTATAAKKLPLLPKAAIAATAVTDASNGEVSPNKIYEKILPCQ